jgi:uncharacterized protein YktB (UPF0637 family)
MRERRLAILVPHKFGMHFKLRCWSSCLLLLFAIATGHAQERRENVFEKVQLELRPRLAELFVILLARFRDTQFQKAE